MPKRITELTSGSVTDAHELAFDLAAGQTTRATVAALRAAMGVGTQGAVSPAVLVGNILAGDSATSFTSGGFSYVADAGNGVALAAALASLSATGGVVYVRRGTYNLQSGAVANGLTVPANVRLVGEGRATVIAGRSTGNQQTIAVADGAALEYLRVTVPTGGTGATGDAAVVVSDRAWFTRVDIDIAPTAASQLRRAVDIADGWLTVRDVRISSSTFIEYDYGTDGPTIGCDVQLVSLGALSGGTTSRIDGAGLELVGGDIHFAAANAWNVDDLSAIQIAGLVSSGWRRAFFCALSGCPYTCEIQNFEITDAAGDTYSTGALGSGVFLFVDGDGASRTNVRLRGGRISAGYTSPASLALSLAQNSAPVCEFSETSISGFRTIALALSGFMEADFARTKIVGAAWVSAGSIAPFSGGTYRLRDASYLECENALGSLEALTDSRVVVTGMVATPGGPAVTCWNTRNARVEASYAASTGRPVHHGDARDSTFTATGDPGAAVCIGSAVNCNVGRADPSTPTAPLIRTYDGSNRITGNVFALKSGASANVACVHVLSGDNGCIVTGNRFGACSHATGINDAATGTIIDNNYVTG